ncbi:uncharacterized protein LOC125029006 [Penaeus chinensis]|uniref:uncharacterized protein LOC125029006 n=1 Tax=Penaeus chinensis TaxID=139456 RepID=UPI001FB78374|nr:uncharacterized protein LOC125029006 [Penaeus chinensis]
MRFCLPVLAAAAVLGCVSEAKIVAWNLPEPRLSLVSGRLSAALNGPKAMKRVTFLMAVNRRVTFRSPQHKVRLLCQLNEDGGKSCSGTGGPTVSPDDVIYYGMKVRLSRRKSTRFKNKKWTPPVTTTTTTTANGTTELTTLPPGWVSSITMSFGKTYDLPYPGAGRGFGTMAVVSNG